MSKRSEAGCRNDLVQVFALVESNPAYRPAVTDDEVIEDAGLQPIRLSRGGTWQTENVLAELRG